MKRVYSILFAGVALVAVASCGNRGKKAEIVVPDEEVTETVAEAVAEETSNEVRMYSNSYDGYTNVRKGPSSKAEVLGKLKNGNEYVVLLGESEDWLEVQYYDQIGYVHKNYVCQTPSMPVTVDVDAKWLEGPWSVEGNGYDYLYILIFSNGKYCQTHWLPGTVEDWEGAYTDMEVLGDDGVYCEFNYGKWHLEGNKILFTSRKGETVSMVINPSSKTIDSYSKVNLSNMDELTPTSKAGFKSFRQRTNKYVK